jgi:hypothetical protein
MEDIKKILFQKSRQNKGYIYLIKLRSFVIWCNEKKAPKNWKEKRHAYER